MTNQTKENAIDWPDLIKRLGDEPIIAKITASFIVDNMERLELLEEAIQTANLNDVKYYAHLLKGSAATIGAKPLAKTVDKLEIMGEQQCLQDAWSVFEETKVEFDRLKQFLAESNWIQTAKRQTNNG